MGENELFRTSVSEGPDGCSEVHVSCMCPACGKPVPFGHKFCGHCGAKLESFPDVDLSGCVCRLVRDRTEDVRVLPALSDSDGAASVVRAVLPDASCGGDTGFIRGIDRYVLFDTSSGVPCSIGCPHGQQGFCTDAGGAACPDLVGWLCLEGDKGLMACAAVCRAEISADFFAY